MADEKNLEEEQEETKSDQSLEVAESEEQEGLEDEALDEVDSDDLEEMEEEEIPEIGAKLVIGQGDFSMLQSNRGADDPGDNTLAEPQFVCKYGDMLFITDRGNHRVLMWNQIPQENGEPASLVLGQEDFADCLENRGITTTLDEMTSGLGDETLDGFTISKPDEDTLSAPAGVRVIDGKLYVVDGGNHRVVRWDSIPSEDGEVPNLVMGQDNLECGEANNRGEVGARSLFFPMGIYSGDDQKVFVADKDNHRVLIWNKIPFNNGWPADITIGQAGMDEREPNRGEFDNVGPATLSFPTGVCFDVENERLFVVDQGNNRVLIWNSFPRENGKPADIVLGQKDMESREVNRGLGSRRTSVGGLFFPTDVVYGRKGLFVSDSGNNRVLCWKEIPTENGQPADLVLGQTNFSDNAVNRNGEPTGSTLNDPYGLFLEEDPEDEEDMGKLYIADRGNSRVVIWDELPEPPQEEEKEEKEDEEHPAYEQEELMGDDDDDFMDEEEEQDELPEEAPSV